MGLRQDFAGIAANDLELTNIGLELKSVVEQFREQVQNLE